MDNTLIHNAYPNLPVVPFVKTTIDLPTATAYLASLSSPTEIKRATYILWRNESGNGQHGVNQNYIGLQADGNTIGNGMDSRVIATCLEPENGTNRVRRFCCFLDYKTSIDYLIVALQARGLYIGGVINDPYAHIAINNIEDWTTAYYKSWVTGNKNAVPPQSYFDLFHSLYYSATQHF